MTDDRDFKRLVRERMAKTGETYTAARAQLRPTTAEGGSVEGFRERLYTRTGTDRLGSHLEDRYGIRVTRLSDLDLGVYRVDRHGAPSWVARVFPSARSLAAVEGDAEILRLLEQNEFPAERCAHPDAVSSLDGQGVLVTTLVPGANARPDHSEKTAFRLGGMVGRLHALPTGSGAMAREAGSWHHLSPDGGGRRADVMTLMPLLADGARRAVAEEQPLYDTLIGELGGLDDLSDLPQALIHPDPCGANAIVSDGSGPVLVDWTGAGRGPRVASLANLIAGSTNLGLVDAVVAGYRAHVQLDGDELDRMAGAIRAFPLILDSWSVVFQDAGVSELVGRLPAKRDRAEVVAQRTRDAFAADISELTTWDDDAPRAQIEGQGTLL